MKTNFIKQSRVVLAVGLGSINLALSAPDEKGRKVDGFQAKDQFENAFTFKPAETRFLLVGMDMEPGKKADAALTALGEDYLPGKKSFHVANIFDMPGAGRLFALPKMRKHSHRIILGDDDSLVARFPQQPGKVTVLALADGKVTSVKYWTPGTDSVAGHLK